LGGTSLFATLQKAPDELPATQLPAPALPVSLADVLQAQDVVRRVASRTPLAEERALSQSCGATVYLKLENLQRTGAFKVRGAFNKIASLSAAQRAKGVITASAGNHAQGVALAASLNHIIATVVMPETVPKAKLQATQAFGAQVVLYGKTFDESLARALTLQQETGATFIHPYDDPMVIAGQGTIGLEILQDLPEVDVVLVPVGGGGLAAGVATAMKGRPRGVRVIGVEPANAPSMAEALKQGRPTAVPVTPTLADGTAVGKSGALTFSILKDALDGLITLTEDEIAAGMRALLLRDKVLAEGAGALGAAALLSGKLDVKGRKVVSIVSGGNVDPSRLRQLLANA
jgi:threonine dehydratase